MRLFLKICAFLLCLWLLQPLAALAQTNAQYQLIASAAQTATTINSPDQTNSYYKGVHVAISVTAYTSGTYTAKIQGKNTVTGEYYDLLVGTAISATGVTVLKLYPGITSSANASSSDILPQTWRVQLNGASTPSMTLSVQAILNQ